jgi:hypothetical protein
MRRLVPAVVVLPFLSACQPTTTELSAEQKAAIAAEVDSVMAERWHAIERADASRSFEAAGSQEFAWAVNGSVLLSYDDYQEYLGPVVRNFRLQDVKVVDTRTVVLAPNIVLTIQKISMFVVNVLSYEPEEELWRFAETLVWEKRNGEWKIILGHGSFPL